MPISCQPNDISAAKQARYASDAIDIFNYLKERYPFAHDDLRLYNSMTAQQTVNIEKARGNEVIGKLTDEFALYRANKDRGP